MVDERISFKQILELPVITLVDKHGTPILSSTGLEKRHGFVLCILVMRSSVAESVANVTWFICSSFEEVIVWEIHIACFMLRMNEQGRRLRT
jgi:hypothetical protein